MQYFNWIKRAPFGVNNRKLCRINSRCSPRESNLRDGADAKIRIIGFLVVAGFEGIPEWSHLNV